ncbi:deaminated glutathione amidase-like [Corticium candelabrum]|uniref:deaminated glutathione amidase-like n=1 Tax=Corticium candelabrum TaxID=121492 RepID=UPI002E26C296|nr:deaminated glutathione amidase-like [Corticium candelabrum]
MVFLPESFDYIAANSDVASRLAEPLEGPRMTRYRHLAKDNDIWLSLGGFHEKGPPDDSQRLYISHVIVDNAGTIVATYRKSHLFEGKIKNNFNVKECDWVIPGKQIVEPIETPAGRVGLEICYDIRFPEMSLLLAGLGADILTFPSAFTVPTGLAHWKVLLRARAIETQCYVIAAAQTGKHNEIRQTFGHAMVVDPWGAIVAQCHEGTDLCLAQIDHKYIAEVRQQIPVHRTRRHDLYSEIKKCNCVS